MSLFQSLSNILGSSGIDAFEANRCLQSDSPPLVLDVREPSEFSLGHIRGARLIPLSELPSRIAELPSDQTILCVCRSGSRSSVAVRQLTRAGLQAINLQGGMTAWQRSGLPISKGRK
ncbi:MAG: rhodanese-like domain-containing protein [Aggregatilineales bacterium]